MKTTFNQIRAAMCRGIIVGLLLIPLAAIAQQSGDQMDMQALLSDIRWKSEQQVRDKFGDPDSIRGPIGTHASYQLWNYPDFSVAFANNRVFHLFDKDSLHKFELNENRESEY